MASENAVGAAEYEKCSDGKLRRKTLPATAEQRHGTENSFIAFVKKLIGMELTRIGFPVSFFEPANWLHRCTEQFANIDSLREASNCDNPIDRMAFVFGNVQAILSPLVNSDRIMAINPILGETFECTRADLGFRMISEQVNHHPPMFALYIESIDKHGNPDNVYTAYGNSTAKASFLGTCIELYPQGFYTFELHKHGEIYNVTTTGAKIVVSNLLRGLDKFKHRFDGEVVLTRIVKGKTKEKPWRAVATYHPPAEGTSLLGGWDELLNPAWCEGYIENGNGEVLVNFYGKYNQEIYSVPVKEWKAAGGWKKQLKQMKKLRSHELKQHPHQPKYDHSRLAAISSDGDSFFDFKLPEQKLLWRKEPLGEKNLQYFRMSQFAMQLNEPTTDLDLPPTDTRFRKDISFLEQGDIDEAYKWKVRLEEKQRADLKLRLKEHGLSHGDPDPWEPIWFKKRKHPHFDMEGFIFTGKYFQRDWKKCPDLGFTQNYETDL